MPADAPAPPRTPAHPQKSGIAALRSGKAVAPAIAPAAGWAAVGVDARRSGIWLGWSLGIPVGWLLFDNAEDSKFLFSTAWASDGSAMCEQHFKNVTAIHTFPLLVVAHRFLLVWLWLLLVVAKLERSDFTNPKAFPNFRK